jgi:16S rRNA (adenine1518-N6/adenine1519-N6)-dimethyltransferase
VKLSAIRAALTELQVTPSKTLGQNFLHDQNLARWIVGQLDAGPGDHLVEIGPGLGALTGAVLETGASLTALEKDGRLAAFLRERFRGQDRLQVEHIDALDFDVRTLWPRRPVKIFGNLPYYISTPLLFHFASPAAPVERAIFLLQRELAARIAARGPGNKDYGILSVIIGRRWRVELLRVLPASVFLPVPKVDSALIRLVPRTADELPPCDVPTFDRLVRTGFAQRRKQLRKLLAQDFPASAALSWPAVAARCGFGEGARGEELTLRQWIELANAVRPVVPAAAQNASQEMFDVVDEQDRPIRVEARGVVHARNLRHRAVHLFVFNAAGELFLQRRSPWKDKHPSKWDSSAAGHVDSGETYVGAARRELAEELGLTPEAAASVRLDEIGGLEARETTGWEFIRVYRVEHDGPFRWPAEEVEWGGFFPVPVVEAWRSAHPEDFAPGFLECWRLWRVRQGSAEGGGAPTSQPGAREAAATAKRP